MVDQKLEVKKQRISKLFLREKTDHVPSYFPNGGYLVYYTGHCPNDVQSFEQAQQITTDGLLDLDPDVGDAYSPNNLWLKPTFDLWGGAMHSISDEGIIQIVPSAIEIMKPEEYPALIKNPSRYILEEVYPRRYKLLAIENPEEKYNKIVESIAVGFQCFENCQTEENAGVISISAGEFINPVDYIFDFMRSFSGIVRDIRRTPEYVRDAGLAIADEVLKFTDTLPRESFRALRCPMHLPPFLKPKDFEKVYWPSFKKVADGVAAQGHNIFYLFEKNYMHLHEYLQELPKNKILGLFEEDDLKTVQKNLGGRMAFAGGITAELLRFGSRDECVNQTKYLIDTFGGDGNFMVSPNIPLVSINDAKPENLKAIYETTKNYGC